MKPIIKWQTHTTEATAKVLGVELSVKSNGNYYNNWMSETMTLKTSINH